MRLLLRCCSQLELGLATRALPAAASAVSAANSSSSSGGAALYCEPVPSDWEAMQTQQATGSTGPVATATKGGGGGAAGGTAPGAAAGSVLLRRRAERAVAAGHKDAVAHA